MSQNGEKELILGNKQLISLFFVVVALCGVFFAMGYMVRGNSVKGSLSTTGDNTAQNTDTTVKRQQPEPPRDATDNPPAPADSTLPPDNGGHTETHPADDTPAPPPAGASTEQKPGPAPLVDVKPAPYADPKTAPRPETLQAGATYVQVSALPRPDAEALVRTLREQHLPALLAPSSNETLYRIYVGPYHQTADVADAKAKLKTLGFSDTIVRKQ
jgi:hypothetical protein